jgi:hypothetical protein
MEIYNHAPIGLHSVYLYHQFTLSRYFWFTDQNVVRIFLPSQCALHAKLISSSLILSSYLMNNKNYEPPHYEIFFNLLLPALSRVKIFLSALRSQTICSSRRTRYQVSHPYKPMGKIIFYILLFTCF